MESFRLILPVITFLLGQLLERFYKRREEESKLKRIIKILAIFIGDEVLGYLSELELKFVQFAHRKIDVDDIENYCAMISSKVNARYQKLSIQEGFFGADIGIASILYVKQVRKYLDDLSFKDDNFVLSSDSFDSFMVDLYKIKLEGYFWVSILVKDFLREDNPFINSWELLLRNEQKRIESHLEKANFESSSCSEKTTSVAFDSLQEMLHRIQELIKNLPV